MHGIENQGIQGQMFVNAVVAQLDARISSAQAHKTRVLAALASSFARGWAPATADIRTVTTRLTTRSEAILTHDEEELAGVNTLIEGGQ